MLALRWIVFVVLIAISGNCAAEDAGAAPQVVRAAFWNIQWFPGRHPFATASSERAQIASVHRDMPKINVDVLGMEEVRDFSKATTAVSPLAGMKVDVVSNFPPREGQDVSQQVAIASRFQPLSAWVEMWKPNGALVPPRGFAFAAYEVAPRHILLVYAVHLKSNRGEGRHRHPRRIDAAAYGAHACDERRLRQTGNCKLHRRWRFQYCAG